jgi:hypothetical protein
VRSFSGPGKGYKINILYLLVLTNLQGTCQNQLVVQFQRKIYCPVHRDPNQ